MKTVYLGLGSNIGEREQALQKALDRLGDAGVHVKRVSGVYETEPIGLADQRWFLNLVVEAETDLLPLQLLGRLQKIEVELGRRRATSQGPRTIDIDILFFGSFVIQAGRLVVPHPRLHERRFVLAPMVELTPDLRHPVFRRTMRDLLGSLSGQTVRRAGDAADRLSWSVPAT
jgi:2-amino-4-hydroxy-6-hydroxymethyldihydropteridine diphosphokinase